MSVIEHEFGKKKRETVRQFTSLLTLDALHEANVLANPVPYLERASEQIYQLEKVLREALEAAATPSGQARSEQTILVNAEDYQRLLTCRTILETALAQRISNGDD
jgi:hypothetical protein